MSVCAFTSFLCMCQECECNWQRMIFPLFKLLTSWGMVWGVGISIHKQEKVNFIAFYCAVIDPHLMLSLYPRCPCRVTSSVPRMSPFKNKAGGGFIITVQSQLIRIGQLVQSNSVPPCSSSSSSIIPLSPFSRTALSVGTISLHHCRLSVRDSDYGSHLHRGGQCTASLSARARQACINVCCRRVGASINRCLNWQKCIWYT